MQFNKDEIKKELTIEQVFNFVEALGGSPIMRADGQSFTSQTICHRGDSHKMYYYENSHLFQCFTNCGYFDVFELVQKIKGITLPQAIKEIVSFFHLNVEYSSSFEQELEDWSLLDRYEILNETSTAALEGVLKGIDEKVIKYFPRPRLLHWEKEGIHKEIIDAANICYDPSAQAIIIPHYDDMGNLIGIRERTLIKEEEVYGKYRPALLNGKLYNHPLSFNLYNLNKSKENIRKMKTAIVVEGEKSTLQIASFLGKESDISVAVCGSTLSQRQVNLLLKYGAEEIIIGFDKQFQKLGDNEFKKWTKKLTELNNKYSPYCRISFLFDKWELLDYKDSPTDKGKEVFLELFKKRIII